MLDHREIKATLEILVLVVTKALLVLKAKKEPQETKEIKVLPVLKEIKETKVIQALREQLEIKVRKELQETKDHKEIKVTLEILVLLVLRDKKELQVLKE